MTDLLLDTRPDVVIVGAGVIGCALALELTRAGFRTLNVDTLPGAGQGMTSSSAGIVRTFATDVEAIGLARAALPLWHGWRDYLDLPRAEHAPRFRVCGSVILDRADSYADAVARTATEVGLPFQTWGAAELAANLPSFDWHSFGPPRRMEDPEFWAEPTGEVDGAFFFPDTGYVTDPLLATQNLCSTAMRLGAGFRFGATVTEVLRDPDRVLGVRLAGGSAISAPVVINAAGVYSDQLNALAGVVAEMRVRTRVIRQELYHVPCPPALPYEENGTHVVDADLGINFRPEPGNAILLGSNGAAADPVDYLDRAQDFEPGLSREMWETYCLRLGRRIPELGMPRNPRGISALYDVTPDWTPIYDRTSLRGFYLAIGTSGNQFKTAAVVGMLMAQLIAACEAGADHDTEPVEVRLPGGQLIHTGRYSRLRDANAAAAAPGNGR